MPPTADEYREGLRLLQQQQRARLTAFIEQVDHALAQDWQRSMGYAAPLYRPLIDQYARDLAALRREMDDPSAKLTLDWLTARNTQIRTIEQSVRASLDTYGSASAAKVTNAQAAAAERGAADAAQLTQRSLWPAVEGAGVPPAMLFNRPNPDAIAQWVGRAGNGHPLGDLFANFGAEATQQARKEMLLGLATGANPRAMAKGISNALGISRSRATIISRTEVLGSYRSAAHETYRANSDVINGWLWSAGGNNPCAMCMGMDGLQFSLEEELVDHPCGKCSPIPITKSWDDILGPWGIDSSDMLETSMGADGAYETGEARFARMSPQQQRAIIGTRTGYDAYRRGEVSLKDFIGKRPAQDGFPASYYQKSLKEMEIPTGRAGSNLVERSPRLTELERAGNLRLRDFGAPIPVDEMPVWAQQSPASQAVYQILRNGLPWSMREQELPLLSQNIEQMLREDLPLNVRLAALRQQDVLKQYDAYLERYFRHVTGGASTLGKAPEFVYSPSKELERALSAARRGETGIAQMAETALARQTTKELTDAEFRDAVLAAHVRNADSSGFSAIRQVRNEVMQQTGISRAEFDARMRAWFDAEIKGPNDLVAHFETNMDAHQGIRGRLTVNGTQYDFLQLSRGSAFENIIAGEAPAGNAYAGSMRGITREAFEAERGIKSAASTDAAVNQAIADARFSIERTLPDVLERESTRIIDAIASDNLEAEAAKAEVSQDLANRLADNPAFTQLAEKFPGMTPEEISSELLHAWADGEGDLYVAIQRAVEDEFGLRGIVATPGDTAAWTEYQPGLRAFVREMYNNTQDFLRGNEITELPLYRGVGFDKLPSTLDASMMNRHAHDAIIELRAASSFTADARTANGFTNLAENDVERLNYRVVEAARVPADLVLSTARTGFGALDETEVVVLGGRYDAVVVGVDASRGAQLRVEEVEHLLEGQAVKSDAEIQLGAAQARAEIYQQMLESARIFGDKSAQELAEIKQSLDKALQDVKELERALSAARVGERTALETAQTVETAIQAAEPVVEKVVSQEALDALQQAQTRVDAMRQDYEAERAAKGYAMLPQGTEDALRDLAKAQAQVDAEMGGRGAVIFSHDMDNPFIADERTAQYTEQFFGHSLTRDELGGLVGAPEGTMVHIYSADDGLIITMNGDGFNASRTLSLTNRGNLVMENSTFFVDSERQAQGLGASIFADQAQTLSDLGVKRIETFAAGDGPGILGVNAAGNNGYYTWARFGYAGRLSDTMQQKLADAIASGSAPSAWARYTTVQQLMRTPEGRAWWKAFGEGMPMRFDLSPDSYSMKVLREYLAAKGRI